MSDFALTWVISFVSDYLVLIIGSFKHWAPCKTTTEITAQQLTFGILVAWDTIQLGAIGDTHPSSLCVLYIVIMRKIGWLTTRYFPCLVSEGAHCNQSLRYRIPHLPTIFVSWIDPLIYSLFYILPRCAPNGAVKPLCVWSPRDRLGKPWGVFKSSLDKRFHPSTHRSGCAFL